MSPKKNKRIKTTVRKTLSVGGSLLLTLPRDFCERNGLEPGSELALIYDHELIIRPWPFEDVARILVNK